MNKSLIAVGLLVATSLAVPALACPGGGACDGPRGGQGMQNGMQRMGQDLNLTDTQKQEIKQIREDARSTMKAMRESMMANRDAMQKLDPADKGYTAKVDKLAAEKGAIVEGMMKEHARVRSEISAILTPEQRAKQAQLHKERKAKRDAKRKERGGNRGEGRGPDGDGPGNGPRGMGM